MAWMICKDQRTSEIEISLVSEFALAFVGIDVNWELRPDVGMSSLPDETPALQQAITERIRVVAVTREVRQFLNV